MKIGVGIGLSYPKYTTFVNRGGANFPFHPSLVDYWSFKGKNNFDKDRNTIKGIKGELLTAYNFGWSLGSGYGLYKTNFLQWQYISSRGTAVVTSDTIYLTETFGNAPFVELGNLAYNPENITVDITGDFGNGYLIYDYHASETEIGTIIIKTPGRYELPKSAKINSGFRTNKATKLDLTIKQIPEYEGAIVTDGVDDYLKLDKVGYKVGTIIIKFKPINIKPNIVNSILNIHTDEVALQYDTSGVLNNNFTTYKNYGEYSVGTFNIDKNAATPLTLGCKLSNSGSPMEYSNVAIYSVAIYQNVLTAEEIQKEINVMKYGTPNPVFALNFDNFAYKAVDYPEFATGQATTNKIVINNTTEVFNGAIAVAMNPQANTGDPIEVPAYKLKLVGFNDYNLPEASFGVAILASNISGGAEYIAETPALDGVYDVPSIALSDGIFNLAIVTQIAIDKPIEIEILYDKNVTKSFPENKQIFP